MTDLLKYMEDFLDNDVIDKVAELHYKKGRLEAFKEISEIIVKSKPEEVFTNILTLFKKEL